MFVYKINKIYIELKRIVRKLFYLRIYRKDTPGDTLKFYNRMRYLYINEFKVRESFSKSLNNVKFVDTLSQDGFIVVNLSEISKREEFVNTIEKFRKKFDEITQNQSKEKKNFSKDYLLNYDLEFNSDVKNIADPFIDIATKYLGTLPILTSFSMLYSANISEELVGSKLLHRDGEDFKQLKIFIPIEEVQKENGPLHVINKDESKKLYENLIKQKKIYRRNQTIDDKSLEELKLNIYKILMNNKQCALVDTSVCYHYGSRKSLKPRKLLALQFTTAFSAKTPIFRSYDSDKKFTLQKDKFVYGLQKKISTHNEKSIYFKV